MKSSPDAQQTVSVAMCTYNGAKYIREQVESILQQSIQPMEIIVCDDGSTDETMAILHELAEDSAVPLQIHRNSMNLGVVANFEKAISLCNGEFIALSDQDDVWVPQKLATMLEHFIQNPQTTMLFTNALLAEDNSKVTSATLWDSFGFSQADRHLFTRQESAKMVAKSLLVTGATVLFRAALKPVLLPFPKGKPTAFLHDEWMAIAAAAGDGLEGLDQNLIHYRIHAAQTAGLPDAAEQQLTAKVARELNRVADDKSARLKQMTDDARFVAELLESRPEFQHSLTAKLYRRRTQFFQFRSSLPSAKWRRVIPVLRAWMEKDYGHFCRRPILAALQDIVA